MSLVDFLSSMEEQEEEMSKLAAEEDAAGRIMARGFMDELNKLAQAAQMMPGGVQMGPLREAARPKPRAIPPSTPEDTGPYGLRSGQKPPKVKGLRAFGGRPPVPPRDQFPRQMREEAARRKKHRPTGIAGLKQKASRADEALLETISGYGRAFGGFGRGLSRTARGK